MTAPGRPPSRPSNRWWRPPEPAGPRRRPAAPADPAHPAGRLPPAPARPSNRPRRPRQMHGGVADVAATARIRHLRAILADWRRSGPGCSAAAGWSASSAGRSRPPRSTVKSPAADRAKRTEVSQMWLPLHETDTSVLWRSGGGPGDPDARGPPCSPGFGAPVVPTLLRRLARAPRVPPSSPCPSRPGRPGSPAGSPPPSARRPRRPAPPRRTRGPARRPSRHGVLDHRVRQVLQPGRRAESGVADRQQVDHSAPAEPSTSVRTSSP